MKIIIYGAGFWGEFALDHLGAENVFCFCDSKIKEGEEGTFCGKKVISFQRLQEIWEDYVIVISAGVLYNAEIGRQLDAVGIDEHFILSGFLGVMGGTDTLGERLADACSRERMFKNYYKLLAKKTETQLEYLKEHADITTLKPAKGAMRREQLALLKFAEDFFEFIKELEIKPFLISGNLLGAFRHKGFVPWDDDWDFGIFRDEMERLIEFLEKNGEVGTRCEEVWRSRTGEEIPWKDIFKVYPDQYILDIRSKMVHVYKSTYGSIWKPGIDLWPFDFYDESYELTEHKKWLQELDERLHEIEEETDKVAFLRKEREANPMISRTETKYIFSGIDSAGGHPGRRDVAEWIRTEDILPLRKVPYEDTQFWAPKDMEALLRCEYKDYMSFPDDVGCPVHIGMDEEE